MVQAVGTPTACFTEKAMKRRQNTNLIDDIYRYLQSQIRQGILLNGMRVSENDLASSFSCSRTPVREALKRLERDGMVVIVERSGTYVRDITMVDYQEVTEVRAYLEALAIRIACEQGSDITVLRTILDEMDEIAEHPDTFDVQRFSSLHYQFHLELVGLGNNEILVQTYCRLNLNEASLLFSQTLNEKGIKKTQDEHRRLLRAIEEQDIKGGEHFMLSHLWKKRNRFKRQAESG